MSVRRVTIGGVALAPSTSAYEIIAGPADLYVAPVGTQFPLPGEVPTDPWTYLGYTEGGVSVRLQQEVKLLRTDIHQGPVSAVRTQEALEVETNLVEMTLENMARILNFAALRPRTSPIQQQRIHLHRGMNVRRHALLVRGDSPYGPWDAQWDIPVVVQTGDQELEYVKDDKTVLPVVWTALEDLEAEHDEARFGQFRAQAA